jgi:hypothetical protein
MLNVLARERRILSHPLANLGEFDPDKTRVTTITRNVVAVVILGKITLVPPDRFVLVPVAILPRRARMIVVFHPRMSQKRAKRDGLILSRP